MRDEVFPGSPALERSLRLKQVDRRRDVGDLAVSLDRLEAWLKPGRLLAHLPGGCARSAISMQRSANFSIIAVRCAIWLLRNHMTMPRKRMLISTSRRNAGGRVESSLSPMRATCATMPCCSSVLVTLEIPCAASSPPPGGNDRGCGAGPAWDHTVDSQVNRCRRSYIYPDSGAGKHGGAEWASG